MNNVNPFSAWQTTLQRDKKEPDYGWLGAWIDGEFRAKVEGDASRYWVRFDDGRRAMIPHKGRITAPEDFTDRRLKFIPVSVGFDVVGEYSILEPKASDAHALITLIGSSVFGGAVYVPGSGIAIDFSDPSHPVVKFNIAGLTEETAPVSATTYIPARTAAGDRKIRLDRLTAVRSEPLCFDGEILFFAGDVIMVGVP